MPWPTAKSNSDLRPTHERYSYSPAVAAKSTRLVQKRAAGQESASERLYRVGQERKLKREYRDRDAAARDGGERLDLDMFDYSLRAGLEREEAPREKRREEEVPDDAPFAPRINARSAELVKSSGRHGAETPAWEELHAKAAEWSEARRQAVEAAREAELEGLSFRPELNPKSLKLVDGKRDGYVEDRLVASWAEGLMLREEMAARAAEEEDSRLKAEAAALLELGAARRRKVADECREHDPRPAHERLYDGAAHTRAKLEAAAEEAEAVALDASVPSTKASRRSLSSLRSSLVAAGRPTSPPPAHRSPNGSPNGGPHGGPTDGAAGDSAHERLYRLGHEEQRASLARSREASHDFSSAAGERGASGGASVGKAGSFASPKMEAACVRLHEQAKAQQRRASMRAEAMRAEASATSPLLSTPGDRAVGTPADCRSSAGSASSRSKGSEARGRQMYEDAMSRMQQRCAGSSATGRAASRHRPETSQGAGPAPKPTPALPPTPAAGSN